MDLDPYLDELKAKKLSKSAVSNYQKTLTLLNEFKPIETIAKADLIAFFNQLECAESTLRLHQSLIKKFFSDIGKPDVVAWIKRIQPKETLRSDDILTPDDINRMIEATESHYFKALIAFLFETGCRISEANKLRYKDFQDTDQGMIVNIPTTKTAAGYRKVILPFSSQYLRNLKAYTNCTKDDIVFVLKSTATHDNIKKIAKKAGIDKPISPHKFRHAQATDMVRRRYNEAIIRKKLGWTPTSGMISRYQHLNDEDVIVATLENAGKAAPHTAPRTEIKEAEKISIADAAMQFSKLSEENQELKERLDKRDAEVEEMQEQLKLVMAALSEVRKSD